MLHWFSTLKFKIVALAVATGVVSALATAHLVMRTTRADIERLLLENHSAERENTASLLANKLDTLQLTLSSLARHTPPEVWSDQSAMQRFLQDNPAVNALFDSVVAAETSGLMMTRLVRGTPTSELRNISERAYFQRALKSDQPQVSDPFMGPISRVPLVVIAVSAPGIDGKPAGIIAGTIELLSARLFSELGGNDEHDGSRSLVMDRAGTLLVHPDPKRVLGRADGEPGLAEVFRRWRDTGSPIETEGTAVFSDGYVVSMAGIPASDWVLVKLTPEESAMRPLVAAQRTAWMSAAGVGFAAALLAGLVAWFLTLPISRLRARAELLLDNRDAAPHRPWPSGSGELAALSRAFQQVVDQRQRRQAETEALLQQLEAVLEHAEVGIALSRNSHFELVSRQFCAILHCDKHELTGQPTRILYPSDDAYDAVLARAEPEFAARGVFDAEVEMVRRDGQPFWAHIRCRNVRPGARSHGTIWTIEDITETRAQRERLTWTSSHDTLTGLANRAAFSALLETAMARAAAEPFCAMFIDLDRFKLVNDTGGHAAGDALLQGIANQLVAQVRRSDTVARLGGDEFAVLLGRCPLSQAIEIAEKMRNAVDGYRLEWEGHSFGVGSSIGLVPWNPGLATAAELLRAADEACYAAKQQGRNRVMVHAP